MWLSLRWKGAQQHQTITVVYVDTFWILSIEANFSDIQIKIFVDNAFKVSTSKMAAIFV